MLTGRNGAHGRIRNKIKGFLEMMGFANRAALIVDRLVYPDAAVMVYRKGKLEIPVFRPGGDLHSIRTCLVGPMYRRLLSSLPLQGPLNVLDAGAHVGGFSLLLEDMGLRFKKLVAIELNPNTALRLNYNLKLNVRDPDLVTVLNVGISGSEGVFSGDFGSGGPSDSMATLSHGGAPGAAQARQIPLKTLDGIIGSEFGSETLDLCKMDIEGSEYDVFENGARALGQVRFLIMELHSVPGKEPGSVLKAIQDLGFQLLVEDPKEHIFLFRNTSL